METIDIVIRIPKRDYNVFKHGRMPNDAREFTKYMVNAIVKGTVLPEGHGDLKDVHDIINKINLNYNNHQSIDAYSLKDMIVTVPTVIEADKAESEEA